MGGLLLPPSSYLSSGFQISLRKVWHGSCAAWYILYTQKISQIWPYIKEIQFPFHNKKVMQKKKGIFYIFKKI